MKEGDATMHKTVSSAEFSSRYNEISSLCHSGKEPVFLMEDKGLMADRLELYSLIGEGIDDIRRGDAIPFDDAISEIKASRSACPQTFRHPMGTT